ncbi:hypothetical protein ACFT2C_05650 [Promicromonospora sp. NPDC057138]|uniref:hypothetical protein n=1 Tax=Promicromonospora sp. NPDC057138 TaxID=3346031 RepID=UPI0036289CBE
MSGLSAEDARQLLVVRNMLTEATQYAAFATNLQRTTAVVLLDGVVERVTHLVAMTRGVKVGRNDGLREMIDNVKADLGPIWRPRGLAEVRQLHRSRNNAQHEGLGPDRDDIPKWSRGTASYVRSLVDAQFDADIDRIVLTDVVRDPDLRVALEEAAADLDAGRAGVCVEKCAAILGTSERRWNELHRPPRTRGFRPILANEPVDEVRRELDDVARLVALAAFASDVAEAAWFLHILHEHFDLLDADDGSRALAFVTNWVIGFEEATTTWVPDRHARNVRARRLVRTDSGQTARIVEIVDVPPSKPSEVSVTVRIGDVPSDSDYDEWQATANGQLSRSSALGAKIWRINDDGTARILIDSDTTVPQALDDLDKVLKETEARLAQQRAAVVMQAETTARASTDFTTALEQWTDSPKWFVEAVRGSDYIAVRLPIGPEGQLPDGTSARQKIAGILRRDPLIEHCTAGAGSGGVVISPPIDTAALIRILTENEAAISAVVNEVTAAEESWEEARKRVKQEARAYLGITRDI